MTRGELMRRMTAREFGYWKAYAALWPLGERAADLRAAVVAATFANAFRDEKKHPTPFAPDDLFPWLAGEPVEETPEETYARMVAGLSVGGHTIIKAGE